MGHFLSENQINSILRELETELDYDRIDYLDLDYDQIQKLISIGPASKFLPPPNPEFEKELPAQNKKGEYEFLSHGEKVVIPLKFAPMIRYSFFNFSSAGAATLPSKSLLEKLWEYIERFIRWVLNSKQKIGGQLEDILINADENYQELRERIKRIEQEHNNDRLFEILLLVPDYFVYLCRLLTDSHVPKEYKVEVALALIYLVSPIDFIPEGLITHPIALMDDTGILLFVIKRGFDGKFISRETVEKHWPGDVGLVDNIGEWYEAAKNVLGKDFIEKVIDYHKGKVQTPVSTVPNRA